MNVNDKLGTARLIICRRFPFFTAGIHALIFREAPGLGTFAVAPNLVCRFDPAVVEEWSVEEIAGVILHEWFHPTRRHHLRREALAADPRDWNVAGDCEINDDILAAGLKLPAGCITPASLSQALGVNPPLKEGLLAEEYYEAIVRARQQQQKGGGKGSGGEAGDQQGGDQQGGDQQEGKDGSGGRGSGREDSGEKPQPGKGWCGGGAGRPVPGEPGPGEDEGDAPGRSEAEVGRAARQVAEAMKEHAATKGRGSCPAGWLRWADDQIAPPKVPWQTKLARAARAAVQYRAGMVDYTYGAPAREQWGVGIGPGKPVLPSFHAPVPRVAVGVDTSGSMGTAEVTVAVREANGILRAVGANVAFLACDAQVHEQREVRSWKEILPLLKGGGGTDFRPLFDAVDRMRHRPDVFVFVTDGLGPAPEQPPKGVSVIWLLVSSKRRPCSWGEFIEID